VATLLENAVFNGGKKAARILRELGPIPQFDSESSGQLTRKSELPIQGVGDGLDDQLMDGFIMDSESVKKWRRVWDLLQPEDYYMEEWKDGVDIAKAYFNHMRASHKIVTALERDQIVDKKLYDQLLPDYSC
jgi:hypothetical protein